MLYFLSAVLGFSIPCLLGFGFTRKGYDRIWVQCGVFWTVEQVINLALCIPMDLSKCDADGAPKNALVHSLPLPWCGARWMAEEVAGQRGSTAEIRHCPLPAHPSRRPLSWVAADTSHRSRPLQCLEKAGSESR